MGNSSTKPITSDTASAPPTYLQYMQTLDKQSAEGMQTVFANNTSETADSIRDSIDQYVNLAIAMGIAALKDPKKPRVAYRVSLDIAGMTRDVFNDLDSVKSYRKNGFKITFNYDRYSELKNNCEVGIGPRPVQSL